MKGCFFPDTGALGIDWGGEEETMSCEATFVWNTICFKSRSDAVAITKL